MVGGHVCVFGVVGCSKRSCKPAELCPAGRVRVYRDNWRGGGGHHHADDLTPQFETKEEDEPTD